MDRGIARRHTSGELFSLRVITDRSDQSVADEADEARSHKRPTKTRAERTGLGQIAVSVLYFTVQSLKPNAWKWRFARRESRDREGSPTAEKKKDQDVTREGQQRRGGLVGSVANWVGTEEGGAVSITLGILGGLGVFYTTFIAWLEMDSVPFPSL